MSKAFLRQASVMMVIARSSTGRQAGFTENVHPDVEKLASKFDYKVLLLKRPSDDKFAPNFYVFPGGVVHKSDFANEWMKLFQKKEFPSYISPPPAFLTTQDPSSIIPTNVAFKITAARELFEEAGILLCKKVNGDVVDPDYISKDDQNEWRERLQKDPSQFVKMCLNYGMIPNIINSWLWSNWMTPAHMEQMYGGNSKRSDNVFYLNGIDEIPEEIHDTEETQHAVWVTPPEILYYLKKNQLRTTISQLYEACRLCHFKSYDDLYQFTPIRGRHGVTRYLPMRHDATDGYFITLPGDSLHPEDPSDRELRGPIQVHETIKQSVRNSEKLNRIIFGANLGPDQIHELEIKCNTGDECGHKPPLPYEEILGDSLEN